MQLDSIIKYNRDKISQLMLYILGDKDMKIIDKFLMENSEKIYYIKRKLKSK